MFKYYNPLLSKNGDVLPGRYVRLFTAGGAEVDLFADASGTPISTQSGVANAAVSDTLGMVRFYVANGTYDLRIYDEGDNFVSAEVGVPMLDAGGVYDDLASDAAGKGASLVKMESGETAEVAILARPTTAALASSTGGEMVGVAGGTNVQAVLDTGILPATGKYGDLMPDTTAASTVAAAFAALGIGGTVASLSEADIGAAPVLNPGVDIVGEKALSYNTGAGGNRVLNRPGRDANRLAWGEENLVRWLEGLRTGETLKVALVGDSNTEGHVGARLATYLDSLPNVSISNFGVSGTNIEQWRTASTPYDSNNKALSDVIAYDPDLIVMCWGTNDPLAARDAQDFATSLSAALTTLRASLDANTCSIALLTPQSMGTADGQDELWSLQIRPIIRAAAETFSCGYFDKNGLFPNSAIDLASGAMQFKWLDSNRLHTTDLSGNFLAALIAEWLVPRELWARVWDNIADKAAADTAATYPPGLSIARMADGAFNGFVATFVAISTGGTFAFQINWLAGSDDGRFAWRVALSGTWASWTIFGADPITVVGSVHGDYTIPGNATGMNTRREGIMVSLSGRMTRAAGQVVTSTTLGNIATTSHRPIFNIQDAVVVALNAGGTVERLRADVTTAGNIVVRESSVMTDATTVSINLTYRGA